MTGLAIHWPPRPPAPLIETNEVHVLATPLDLPAAQLETNAAILSPDECERAEKFSIPQLRDRFIGARGALRRVLGDYLGRPAEQLNFSYEPRGKPALEGFGLHFNVAHSHDLALIAVTRVAPVGVDVEKIRPVRDAQKIAERYFTSGEAAALRVVPEVERDAAFYRLWTRKEAWLKATGHGISEALSKFEITFQADDPVRVLAVEGDPALGAKWHLSALSPASGFVGAVALQHPEVHLQCWRAPF